VGELIAWLIAFAICLAIFALPGAYISVHAGQCYSFESPYGCWWTWIDSAVLWGGAYLLWWSYQKAKKREAEQAEKRKQEEAARKAEAERDKAARLLKEKMDADRELSNAKSAQRSQIRDSISDIFN
jgi:membrane protein implicated in regulation of membrane protease activity